jgi:signal transduction histidine kinase
VNLISFLDLVACLGFILSFIFAMRNRRTAGDIPFPPVLGIIILGFLSSLAGWLSWSGITEAFSRLQTYTSVLLPAAFFWLFVLVIFHQRRHAMASRNQVLAAIHAATEKETRPEDPFGQVRDLLGRVSTLLRFDAAAIFGSRGEDRLQLAVQWNLEPALALEVDTLDSSSSLTQVLESGEPLLVARTDNFPDPITRVMGRHGLVSLAIFPLSTRSRPQGILVLGSREAYHFSSEVVDLLKFVGRHLGEVLLASQLAVELREKQAELERALESRRVFLSIISRDLREPLNVIKGAMLVIHHHLDKTDDPEVVRSVEMASASSRRLERFVGDMLDLAHLGSGGARLDFVPMDPVAELKAVGEEYRQDAARKGVALRFALPSRLPPLEADKTRFHQVIRNVLANAVRFTPAGGEIVLSAETEGENILVRISDTGEGIPPGELPRIYDLFFRGGSAGGEQAGPGLGLSIVREVVRLHGGQISAQSAPGKGTVVGITLPRVHLPI